MLELELNKKIEEYKALIEAIKKSRVEEVDGNIIVAMSHGKIQYYQSIVDRSTRKRKRVYIKKGNGDLLNNLANKHCYDDLLGILVNRLMAMENLAVCYSDDEVDDYLEAKNPEIKKMADIIIPTYKQIVENWLLKPYRGLSFRRDDPIIYTKNGDRVRSKSEKILADLFYDLCVGYKYEYPLTLKNGITYYPDFTFISPYTKKEIYWEHFGRIDDVEYAPKFIEKMQVYEDNGLIYGQNLLITFESSKRILDVKFAKSLVEKYLKK